MSDSEESSDTGTVTKEELRIKHPKQYKVILLNDDYTTMDFVISILESVFKKSPVEASQIMLQVHKAGRGLAGIYNKEIAEAKSVAVHARAKASGYPLRCSIEEA